MDFGRVGLDKARNPHHLSQDSLPHLSVVECLEVGKEREPQYDDKTGLRVYYLDVKKEFLTY